MNLEEAITLSERTQHRKSNNTFSSLLVGVKNVDLTEAESKVAARDWAGGVLGRREGSKQGQGSYQMEGRTSNALECSKFTKVYNN